MPAAAAVRYPEVMEDRISLRIPPELRAEIVQMAKASRRTLTLQVIYLLERGIECEKHRHSP